MEKLLDLKFFQAFSQKTIVKSMAKTASGTLNQPGALLIPFFTRLYIPDVGGTYQIFLSMIQ